MSNEYRAIRSRLDFSKIPTAIQIPNLIEVQRRSYERFLQMDKLPNERDDNGLQSVFTSVFPITDFRNISQLDFVDFSIGNWECKCGHLKGLHHLRTACVNCGSMVITGAKGERVVNAEDYFIGPGIDITRMTVLQPGELLTAIRVPATWAGKQFYFEKVRDRQVWDFALVSVASAMVTSGETIRNMRLVVNAVAARPLRLVNVGNEHGSEKEGELNMGTEGPLLGDSRNLPPLLLHALSMAGSGVVPPTPRQTREQLSDPRPITGGKLHDVLARSPAEPATDE